MATSKLPSKPKPKAKPKRKAPSAAHANLGMFGAHPDPSMNPVGPPPSDPALTAPQGATSVPGQAPLNPRVPPAHPDAALLDVILAALAAHRGNVK